MDNSSIDVRDEIDDCLYLLSLSKKLGDKKMEENVTTQLFNLTNILLFSERNRPRLIKTQQQVRLYYGE